MFANKKRVNLMMLLQKLKNFPTNKKQNEKKSILKK
jgi:hypothetical protein